MTDVEKKKKLIRSVLLSTPEGIPMERLGKEYAEITLEQLPSLGYKNVNELCHALTDVIRIERRGSLQLLFAVSAESTKHVEVLIANQKKKKISRTVSHYGGFSHYNGFHKSLLSRNTRSNPVPANRQPRRTNQYVPAMRHTPDYKPNRTEPNQGRSVWDRLGKPTTSETPAKQAPPNRDPSPERVVSVSSDDSLLTSPSPRVASDKWKVPPNSPKWRDEYFQARTYPIRDVPAYARPGEIIYAIGYFIGPRQVQERTLKSGRILKLSIVNFPIYDSTFVSSNSVPCTFKYPSWSIITYNSPHHIPEKTWLKVYGSYSDGELSVSYLEVFNGVSKQNDIASVMSDMSSLSIANTIVTPPEDSNREVRLVPSPLSNHSTSPSDTSVYTDSGTNSTEEDEAGDQGYFSPAPVTGRTDFPHSNSLSAFNVPHEFSSRVKSISSITHFYLVMDENDGALDTLTNSLTTWQKSLKSGNVLIPGECKDLLCSAYNVTASQWHRAKFLNSYPNGSSTYAVSFIDLGEDTQVPVGYIRPFLHGFLKLSAQALPCSLPLPQEMVADQQLISLFRRLVWNVSLKTRVNKMSDNKFQVDLTTQDDKNIVSEIMSAFTDKKSALANPSNNVTRPRHFSLPLPGSDVFSPIEGSPPDILIPPSIPSPVVPGITPIVPLTQLPIPTPPNNTGHFFPNNGHTIAPIPYPIPQNRFMNQVNPARNDKPPTQLTTYFTPHSPTPVSPIVLNSSPILATAVFHFPLRLSSPYPGTMPIQRPNTPSYGYNYNPQYSNVVSHPAPLAQELLQLIRYESLPKSYNFKARVTSILSLDKFYVQNIEKEKELTKLMFSLPIHGKVNKKETSPSAPVEYCLAEIRSKEWVRVQVKYWNMRSMEARIFLLDNGTEETVPISRLHEISPKNLQLPFQAILAKLDGVTSLVPNQNSTVIFRNLTTDKVLVAWPKLPSPSLVLVDTSVIPDRNINELLISTSIA